MSAMDSLLNNCGKKKAENNSNNNNSSSIDNNNHSSFVGNSGSIDKSSVCGCVSVTVGLLILFSIFIFDPLHNDQDGIPKLEFQINSVDMKVYNNNVSNDYYSIIVGNTKQQLMADLEFNLTLKNKEHGLMYFSSMEMSLEYEYDDPDELVLSSTMLEPFLLVEDQRQLQFGMQIKDDLQNMAVDSIFRDLSDQNVVPFALKLKGKGRCVPLHRGVYYNCGINLFCDDIKARFLPARANNFTAGSMIVGPLLCNATLIAILFM